MIIAESCALCAQELSDYPINDALNAFCCPGCHAVFNILESKNQLKDFQSHPLFLQAVRSGLISNPALIAQIKRNRENTKSLETEKFHLEINDMWCPSCAEVIRLILLQERGVINCVVDYATDLASIEFSPRDISKEKILGILSSMGYRPCFLQDSSQKAVSMTLYLRFIVAAFCALNVMMFAYPLYATYFDYDDQGYGLLFAWLSLGASIPVLTYCAWPIVRRFITALSAGLFGMEALVVMGVSTAFGLSLYNLLQGGTKVYFDSMSVIIALVLLGKIIEQKAKFRAKDSLFRLSRALPRKGRKLLSDGTFRFVPIKEILQGDILQVLMGEKIVLDGVVTRGEGSCDESFLTGESMPVEKVVGSSVIAGAILQNGQMFYRVTASEGETILHRIIELVEQDITHKTSYVRSADSIVRWFVPLVISVAMVTAGIVMLFRITDEGTTVLETAIIRAVSILLISCPCAIGIAAPLAEAHLINALAGLGAIIRNRGCLRFLGNETVYVFDKTGTITEGLFQVLKGINELTVSQRQILKGLAIRSNHPVSIAIASAIKETEVEFSRIDEYSGKGLKGKLNGGTFFLGSERFLTEQGYQIKSFEVFRENQEPATKVHFVDSHSNIFEICLGDKIKKDAPEVITSLYPINRILLSGDNEQSVSNVAKSCGFDLHQSQASPLEKREYVEKLKEEGNIVCMLGDGINDSPALTSAHIGISVVTATDISIQVSDILLTTDRMEVIPKIRKLAVKGRRILNQNLFWAFFYNVVGIGLAAFGILSPIFAAFAMSASSLMVLFNARRL